MITRGRFIKQVMVSDVDTKQFLFFVDVYATSEQSIREYVVITKDGREAFIKRFMDGVEFCNVRVSIMKALRGGEFKIN
jgi:hypothetical protein